MIGRSITAQTTTFGLLAPPRFITFRAQSTFVFSRQNLARSIQQRRQLGRPALPQSSTRTTVRRSIMTSVNPFPAIAEDDEVYRPFLKSPIPGAERGPDGELAVDKEDWVQGLELDETKRMVQTLPEGRRVKILILYGSLRERYVPPAAV